MIEQNGISIILAGMRGNSDLSSRAEWLDRPWMVTSEVCDDTKVADPITSFCGAQTQSCSCGNTCQDCRARQNSTLLPHAWTGPVPSLVPEVLASPGAPLESRLRGQMESRFGHDFGRCVCTRMDGLQPQPRQFRRGPTRSGTRLCWDQPRPE